VIHTADKKVCKIRLCSWNKTSFDKNWCLW